MPNQQKTIEALKAAGLRETTKVMIGGAPTTRAWADEIGADGYAEDAIEAVSRGQGAGRGFVSPDRDRELPEGAAADGGRPLVIPCPKGGRPLAIPSRCTVRRDPHAVRRRPSAATLSPATPSRFRSPRGPGRVCLL